LLVAGRQIGSAISRVGDPREQSDSDMDPASKARQFADAFEVPADSM
jgi:hypothetical protein